MRYIVKTAVKLTYAHKGYSEPDPIEVGQIVEPDIPDIWDSFDGMVGSVEDISCDDYQAASAANGSSFEITFTVLTRFENVKDRAQLDAAMDAGWIVWPEDFDDGEGGIWWLNHTLTQFKNEVVAEYT